MKKMPAMRKSTGNSIVTFMLMSLAVCGQGVPMFGPEHPVAVTGYTADLMEPFISGDGSVLFFNSLNSGGNTNLHYATRQNDTTFIWGGLVTGCHDSTANHLDAVASADTSGNFFWVSLRGYPGNINNLHTGSISGTTVTSIRRVYGNMNINTPGWLIMDACVNKAGYFLAFANARFDFVNNTCGGLPCESKLGIAIRANDSTFDRLPSNDFILQKVNNAQYLVYAPQLSDDNLRLYFTRLKKGTTDTEICVAVRTIPGDAFGTPVVLVTMPGKAAEAPTFSPDEQLMYYHRLENGKYTIFLRQKTGTTSIDEPGDRPGPTVYPNPASKMLYVNGGSIDQRLIIFSVTGAKMLEAQGRGIDISSLPAGVYVMSVISGRFTTHFRFIRADGSF